MPNNDGPLHQFAKAVMDFLSRGGLMGDFFLAGVAFFCAWLLMFMTGGAMIRWLKNKQWRKDAETWQVREDTPETHQKKQGTPSMGGIGIIGTAFCVFTAILGTLLFLAIIANPSPFAWSAIWPDLLAVFLVALTTVAHAGLGFADDWSKASGRGGLRARTKLIGQVSLESLFLMLFIGLASLKRGSSLDFDLSQWVTNPVSANSWLIFFFGLLWLLVWTCNAVNLTDGIDGLAAGLAVQAGLVLLLLHQSPGDENLFPIMFMVALAGSCLGFLSYNKYPAKVFMGDTGSLAIGAAIGAAAIMTHSVFLLPFIAFIYFVEAISVTVQVAWFKFTRKKYGEGRRIFRRAPLHHHFELGGWSEWRVVGTFWAINFATSAIGLILWHLGILPRFP